MRSHYQHTARKTSLMLDSRTGSWTKALSLGDRLPCCHEGTFMRDGHACSTAQRSEPPWRRREGVRAPLGTIPPAAQPPQRSQSPSQSRPPAWSPHLCQKAPLIPTAKTRGRSRPSQAHILHPGTQLKRWSVLLEMMKVDYLPTSLRKTRHLLGPALLPPRRLLLGQAGQTTMCPLSREQEQSILRPQPQAPQSPRAA